MECVLHEVYLPKTAFQWRHNQRYGISNYQEISKSALPAFCEENPSVTGGFPSQRAGNAESVSIAWCHNELW